MFTATYSPEDNKLRLYASERLPKELYERVRAAGFIWAPRQQLFVAPTWTPDREDLLIELAGQIDDEDTSLVERAEERAERFDTYSDKRADEADRAHAAVASIADNIPLGQPILVGHHSEARARKDAEKIENGMRKAVNLWKTSQYWKDRAEGAIAHAKYKELPAVRARRIKGLEAEKRKQERGKVRAEQLLKLWNSPKLTLEIARKICGGSEAGYLPCVKHEGTTSYWHAYDVLQPDERRYKECPSMTLEQVQEISRKHYPSLIAFHDRWLSHLENRLTYERTMLGEQGGTAADRTKPEKGGACRCWASPQGGWSYIQKVNKVSVSVLDNWGNGGGNFTRTIPFDKLAGMMSAAQVQAAKEAGELYDTADKTGFYLSTQGPVSEKSRFHQPEIAGQEPEQPKTTDEQAEKFENLADALKSGVQVVSAPQLFPTPADLARRIVELADVRPGHRVLEPSAGTGNIIRAIINAFCGLECGGKIVAVEINYQLAQALEEQRNKTLYATEANFDVRCSDFLACNGELGQFDRIVMNPPFANAQDIQHIEHARKHLKPGGRLVAICANGPRQRERLMPQAIEWIDLEPGAFAESGTNVNAAIVVFDAE